ncbi:hypothetical protein JNW88_28650 [Micromonospora sp. ATA32]|nr:hypothetical protein [Micromonospora sp. ATA32]
MILVGTSGWQYRDWRGPFYPAYVYFNNDPGGAAVVDAVAFARLSRHAGRSVSRTA